MASFTSSDGVTIVYDDLGPRAGAPVVLCHGLAAAGEQMAADAAFFAGLGHRVLVPDLRGHGRSGKPSPMRPEGFSIARMADDLVQMLDDADTAPVHWVGNSLGGILALHMLGAHESRFASLATFGTAYRLILPRSSERVFLLGHGVLGPRLAGLLTGWTTTRDEGARALIARLVRQFDPQVGALIVRALSRYDLIGNAVAARLPILLLRGGRDGAVNRALGPTLRAIAERPNVTLVELPRGGHCANLDATDQWRAALLGFWAGVPEAQKGAPAVSSRCATGAARP